MSTSQTRLFRALISKLEPKLQAAFLKAVSDLKDGINWKALNAALRAGDIEAAIEALDIEAAVFEAYRQATTNAFAAGGALAAQTVNLPRRSPIQIRFNMSNPAAEAWIKKNVADKIVEKLVPETVLAVREVIIKGYALGKHPDDIARDIGGRVVGGRRRGGVLGLSPDFSNHVRSMEDRLRSGDPLQMQKVLQMQRRDKSFDKRLIEAIEGGSKLDNGTVKRMLERYEDRLIRLRAETIARTETGMAVMNSRRLSWQQALDKLGKPPEAIVKTWRYGGGAKDPRVHHQLLNGTSVRGFDTPFDVGGTEMQHALDEAGGAKECANCTCGTDFRIDYTFGLANG